MTAKTTVVDKARAYEKPWQGLVRYRVGVWLDCELNYNPIHSTHLTGLAYKLHYRYGTGCAGEGVTKIRGVGTHERTRRRAWVTIMATADQIGGTARAQYTFVCAPRGRHIVSRITLELRAV